jgi:hypothetical protein
MKQSWIALAGITTSLGLMLSILSIIGVSSTAASTTTPIASTPFRCVGTTFSPVSGQLAVDPGSGEIFVTCPLRSRVTVFDPAGAIVHTFTGLNGAEGLAIANGTAFVSLHDNGEIEAINTTTFAVRQLTPDAGTFDTLAYTEGALWGYNSGGLDKINPTTGTATHYTIVGLGNFLVSDPANPDLLFDAGTGSSPSPIYSINLSGTPTRTAHNTGGTNLRDIAVTPAGTTVVSASGYPYHFEEYNAVTLHDTGANYPAGPYPTAAAFTAENGGLFAGGISGGQGKTTDLFVYHLHNPSDFVASAHFGTPNEASIVEPGQLGFSPDGQCVYAVTWIQTHPTLQFERISLTPTGCGTSPAEATVSGAMVYGTQEKAAAFTYTSSPTSAVVSGHLTCPRTTATQTIGPTLQPGTYTLTSSFCSGLSVTGGYWLSYASKPTGFVVSKAPQVILFTGPSTGTVGDSVSLHATGGRSSNPVTFGVDPSSGPGVCSVKGTTVSYLAAGTCVLDANQAGNADYYAATQVTQSVAVSVATSTPPPRPPAPSPPRPPSTISSAYDLVGSDGGVFVFPTGSSGGFYGSLPELGVHVDDIVGMVPTSDDNGYFLVGSDGGVFSFGSAPFLGSLPGLGVKPAQPVAGIVPTGTDGGYFLVGKDGGVYSFGNAPFLGSLPGGGVHTDNVIGIAATPSGNGYWIVTATGTVYAYGAAQQLGSATGTASPVSAIAGTPTGGGYWIVTQNGSVDAFGNAAYFGSLPALGVAPSKAVIGVVHTSGTGGYWLIGSDGGIFAFGDAGFVGSLPGLGVGVDDIVGAVPTSG